MDYWGHANTYFLNWHTHARIAVLATEMKTEAIILQLILSTAGA